AREPDVHDVLVARIDDDGVGPTHVVARDREVVELLWRVGGTEADPLGRRRRRRARVATAAQPLLALVALDLQRLLERGLVGGGELGRADAEAVLAQHLLLGLAPLTLRFTATSLAQLVLVLIGTSERLCDAIG